MITYSSGQLGNRLLTHCNVLAYAIEHGHGLVNLGITEYRYLFARYRYSTYVSYPWRIPGIPKLAFTIDERTRRILLKASANGRWGERLGHITLNAYQPGSLTEESSTETIRKSNICLLSGLKFQHPLLVEKHNEKIRELMKFSGNINNRSNPEYRSGLDKDSLLIACHIRQGDYEQWRKGEFYFSSEAYVKTLTTLSKKLDKQCRFLIFSNAPQDPDIFSELDCIFSNGSIEDDLTRMMHCDLILGPPSTFSLWASFAGAVPLAFLRQCFVCPDLHDFRVRKDLQYEY